MDTRFYGFPLQPSSPLEPADPGARARLAGTQTGALNRSLLTSSTLKKPWRHNQCFGVLLAIAKQRGFKRPPPLGRRFRGNRLAVRLLRGAASLDILQ